jgi:hypothetical protein
VPTTAEPAPHEIVAAERDTLWAPRPPLRVSEHDASDARSCESPQVLAARGAAGGDLTGRPGISLSDRGLMREPRGRGRCLGLVGSAGCSRFNTCLIAQPTVAPIHSGSDRRFQSSSSSTSWAAF